MLIRAARALGAIALVFSAGAGASPVPRTLVPPAPATRERLLGTPRDGSRLLLAAAVYDPLREEPDFSPWGLDARASDDLGVVQLRKGARLSADALTARGIPVLGYLPDAAFLVRLSPEAGKILDGWGDVRWYGPLVPGLRVAPGLLPRAPGFPGGEIEVHFVTGTPSEALASAAARLRAMTGATETSRRDGPGFPRLVFAVPASLRDSFVRAASAQPGALFIDVLRRYELHNNESLGPLQSGVASVISNGVCSSCGIFSRGLAGTGQIVAVADSGNDSDMCFFRKWNGPEAITSASAPALPAPGPLFPARKVVGYFVQPGATAYDNNEACSFSATGFHGTHVSATAVGDDLARPSSPGAAGIDAGDGMAPQAQLLFQDIGNDVTGCLSGLSDIAGTLEQARLSGARIHTNSWGARASGVYTGDDQIVDAFLFDHDEMAVFFSAGNAGPNGGTLASPAIAKNVVTVGSVGHGTSTTVSSFSSRGPAADLRIKPDVVAPGEDVLSAAGSGSSSDLNCATKTLSGTSMSTPAVAGAAALLRQYFALGFHPTGVATAADALAASGPLVKAVLLNGTMPMDGAGAFGGPDTGWGRPNLDANLFFAGDSRSLRAFAVANADGLATGETRTYTVTVPAGAQELRATLVWFDAEAGPGAATALVNDLDLAVTDGNLTFRGNVFDGAGVSVTGGTADLRNTVEQVRLTAPAAGTYTLTVTAVSVPGNGRSNTARQGYALVFSAAACATGVSAAPTGLLAAAHPVAGTDLTFVPAAGSLTTQVYRAPGGCTANAADFQLVGHSTGPAFTDARAAGGATYGYRMRGADGCGEGPVSACVEITPTGSCDREPAFAGLTLAVPETLTCRVKLSWSAAAVSCPLGGTARYNVYRDVSAAFVPSASTLLATVSALSYDDDSGTTGTTYFYVVRAEDETVNGTGPGGGNEDPNTLRVFATPGGPPGPLGTFTDGGGDGGARLIAEAPWRLTAASAHSGSSAYRAGADGPYLSSRCASLTTPTLFLGTGSVLSYAVRYNLETGWDGVVVEISTDGGASFVDLPPAAGYPGSLSFTGAPPTNACGLAASRGAFTGPNFNPSLSPWTVYTKALSPAFDGKPVSIRFRFTSDAGTAYEGFLLDSISVTNVHLPTACVPPGSCASPAAAISGSATICAGDSTEIRADLTGTAPFRLTWSDGLVQENVIGPEVFRSVSPSTTTAYSVTALDDGLCAGTPTGTAIVTVTPLPASPQITGLASVCTNAPFTLGATPGYDAYQWTKGGIDLPGETAASLTRPAATAADSGTYAVTGRIGLCTSTPSLPVSVTVAPCPAPTAATLSPGCGNVTGGRAVTLLGSGFQPGATVTFMNAPASVSSVAPDQIVVVAPSRAVGPAVQGDVVVRNPDGQTARYVDAWIYALRGDANNNGVITPADSIFLNLAIFLGGTQPLTLCNGDANGNQALTPADSIYLNLFVFLGGAPPPP